MPPDFITNSSTGLTNSANSSSILALPRQKKSLVIATAVMSKMKPPLYMVSTQTQTKGGDSSSVPRFSLQYVQASGVTAYCNIFTD